MKTGPGGESLLLSAINACRSRLSAFIRGRTPVRDDADDILQEVTCQLMTVEQPVENVAAWLFRAARNEMTSTMSWSTAKPAVRFRAFLSCSSSD